MSDKFASLSFKKQLIITIILGLLTTCSFIVAGLTQNQLVLCIISTGFGMLFGTLCVVALIELFANKEKKEG